MRLPILAAAAVLAAIPGLASAQLASRSISVESGLATPLGGGGATGAALALAASTWLDELEVGALDGVLRVAWGSARETDGRAPAGELAATAGLRLSLGRAPLRPQLLADLGWSWRGTGGGLAFGVAAGVEAFVAADVSVALRVGLRGAGSDAAAEGLAALAAYF